jgi:aryl-alcohol dehydrogenase-like predicted oxidoreductase
LILLFTPVPLHSMPNELTTLDNFRLLGRSALRVSPLCLGTMTFGQQTGWGSDKDESRRVWEAYTSRGGNFIDTANLYTGGTSEEYIGEFMGDQRDAFVLATKYTLSLRRGGPNASGNHRKSMVQAIEGSLRRLKTHYIDLYWVHAWDSVTPTEEVMRALDDLVRAGKVLHVGISDAPAWIVAEANVLAQWRGWSPFVALQIKYNLIERTPEHELMPMARHFGIAVTPWSPLEGGVLTGKYNEAGDKTENPGGRNVQHKLSEHNLTIARAVAKLAEDIGRTPSQVALNWLMQRPGMTSPIIGARTVDQLNDNLGCLDFRLDAEQLEALDKVSATEPIHPHELLANPFVHANITGETKLDLT